MIARGMFGMLKNFLLTQELMGGRELHLMPDSQITTVAAEFSSMGL